MIPVGFQCECGSETVLVFGVGIEKKEVIILARCLDCRKFLTVAINPSEYVGMEVKGYGANFKTPM